MKNHRNPKVSTQPGKQNLTKKQSKKLAKITPNTTTKSSGIQKSMPSKKMASNNPPTHYRVLNEHTPTNTTPH
ncbi:hypothetical protein ACLQ3C_21630, partial [Gordonia sp. DT30]|uniref:hypothetical protein n=1 Tax=Gordonia sp. DT30 TaxID=3416546 RepID=UPI003CF29926